MIKIFKTLLTFEDPFQVDPHNTIFIIIISAWVIFSIAMFYKIHRSQKPLNSYYVFFNSGITLLLGLIGTIMGFLLSTDIISESSAITAKYFVWLSYAASLKPLLLATLLSMCQSILIGISMTNWRLLKES